MSRFQPDRQRLDETPDSAGRRPLRLFVEAPLAAGQAIVIDRPQAHYLANVMRRTTGDPALLFNGTDGEWHAHISEMRRGRSAVLEVGEQSRPQSPEPDLWLIVAPVKRIPFDLIVMKATELGASTLLPVQTHNAVVHRVNARRMRANAIEAAEQCHRLTVPRCLAPISLESAIAEWPSRRRLLFCDESGDGMPIASALAGVTEAPWAVMVGPEGGLSAEEAALLKTLPQTVCVSLGPRVMRTETAAIAALACWQALLGDWRPAASGK